MTDVYKMGQSMRIPINWIKHNGECVPLENHEIVLVMQRCGWKSNRPASVKYWASAYNNWVNGKNKFSEYDIIAYKVIPPGKNMSHDRAESNQSNC